MAFASRPPAVRRVGAGVAVGVGEQPGAEALMPRVLVERPAAADGVAQPVGERADAGAAELALRGLLEPRVVRHLAEVPALAVEVDRLAVDAVLAQRQLVERRPDVHHVLLRVVAHQVEPEAVDLVVLGPQHHRVDHHLPAPSRARSRCSGSRWTVSTAPIGFSRW